MNYLFHIWELYYVLYGCQLEMWCQTTVRSGTTRTHVRHWQVWTRLRCWELEKTGGNFTLVGEIFYLWPINLPQNRASSGICKCSFNVLAFLAIISNAAHDRGYIPLIVTSGLFIPGRSYSYADGVSLVLSCFSYCVYCQVIPAFVLQVTEPRDVGRVRPLASRFSPVHAVRYDMVQRKDTEHHILAVS